MNKHAKKFLIMRAFGALALSILLLAHMSPQLIAKPAAPKKKTTKRIAKPKKGAKKKVKITKKKKLAAPKRKAVTKKKAVVKKKAPAKRKPTVKVAKKKAPGYWFDLEDLPRPHSVQAGPMGKQLTVYKIGRRRVGIAADGNAYRWVKSTRQWLPLGERGFKVLTKTEYKKLNGGFNNRQQYTSRTTGTTMPMTFNFTHIFEGDYDPATNVLQGFHHDENSKLKHLLKKQKRIRNIQATRHGIYQADIKDRYGNWVSKVFFPKTWNRQKVMRKIIEAFNNARPPGPQFTKADPVKGTRTTYLGPTSERIFIEMVVDDDTGFMVTAFAKVPRQAWVTARPVKGKAKAPVRKKAKPAVTKVKRGVSVKKKKR